MQHIPRHVQSVQNENEVQIGFDELDEIIREYELMDDEALDDLYPPPWPRCPRCRDYMCTHGITVAGEPLVITCCICGYMHRPTKEFLDGLDSKTRRWYLREWNIWLYPYPRLPG